MSFTYDLSSNVGLVRLHLGDTVEGRGPRPDGTNISDEEINVFLAQEGGDVLRAVAACCEMLATAWANVTDLSVGARSERYSHISEAYAERARTLREIYGHSAVGGAFSVPLVRQPLDDWLSGEYGSV